MSEQDILIREARPEDVHTLLEFQQGVVAWERQYDPTIAKRHVSYYDIEKLISNEEAMVLIAEAGGRPIGCGIGMEKEARHYLDHKTYAYLGLMYVDPQFRGQGVNAIIIERLKNWAYAKGLKEIRLTVYEDNLSAIKAYEKIGFKKHISEMRIQ
ncbi:GNAT family N-acetyltransferase [Maribacter algicola]|uniref:GNAT family N-acetyltransferase n=1 Tax=Meishania litoralis TaxID=3434685 RepID=A0ACC7LNX1_9FLAO